MNSIDNLAYKIADILGKNNDFPFIASARNTAWNIRSKYLRQDFNKNLLYRESALQDLGEIKLVAIPADEQKRFAHCKIKRSEKQIPLPVEVDFHNKFKYIGSIDGSPEYQPTTEFEVENSRHDSIPNLFPSFFLKNGFLYVVNGGNSVKVIAMFQYPEDAAEFADNPNSNCETEDDAYIPGDLTDDIEAEMLRKYNVKTSDTETNEIKL